MSGDHMPAMPGAIACGLSQTRWSVRIPFTKYRIELIYVIVANGKQDEINKELILRGFFKRKGV